jgi:hypothetical protein
MSRPLYRPSPRQAACLAALAFAALTYGFVMRYRVIEQSDVGIACEGGGANWLCANRRTAIALFTPQVFGIVALGAALLNLVRPSVVFWALALLAGGAGIVLYNTAAVGARRRAADPQPGATRARSKLIATRASAAANHSACQLASVSFQTMKTAHGASTAPATVSARGLVPVAGARKLSSTNGSAAAVNGANGKSR